MTEFVQRESIHERDEAQRHSDAQDAADDETLRIRLQRVVRQSSGAGGVSGDGDETQETEVKRRIRGCPSMTEPMIEDVLHLVWSDFVDGPAPVVGKSPREPGDEKNEC